MRTADRTRVGDNSEFAEVATDSRPSVSVTAYSIAPVNFIFAIKDPQWIDLQKRESLIVPRRREVMVM